MSKRDGISFMDQLLSTPNDGAHRKYFAPLPNAEDEETAHDMATAVYLSCVDKFADDFTKGEADAVLQQCLADARRMVCEPEYNDLLLRLSVRRLHR